MIHKALLDGVIQAHGDGFENLLMRFSFPQNEGGVNALLELLIYRHYSELPTNLIGQYSCCCSISLLTCNEVKTSGKSLFGRTITTPESCLYYTATIRFRLLKALERKDVRNTQEIDMGVNLFPEYGLVSRSYFKKSLIMVSIFGSKSKSFMTMSIPPQDFAKPVKAIFLPQDVPNTSDRHLIELENQVQCFMEAHLAPRSSVQVNKITSSCEICSGPHDTQYCIENPEQDFVDYASSRTDKAGGKWFTFKLEQNNLGDTYNPSWKSYPNLRLSKFEVDFKQQQSEMTNKIDTFLKGINNRMTGALPSDTVKNMNLNVNPTSLVLSARSYPMEDPQSYSTLFNSESARDVELNPFKNVLVFRKMVEFLGTIPINLKGNMWESKELIEKRIDWNRPPKEGDGAWHIRIELIDPDGEKFNKAFQSIPTTRKLSDKENPSEIIDLDHFHDSRSVTPSLAIRLANKQKRL
ncbi:hypothetical protein Tco_0149698 [Tanacetum coccineum]